MEAAKQIRRLKKIFNLLQELNFFRPYAVEFQWSLPRSMELDAKREKNEEEAEVYY